MILHTKTRFAKWKHLIDEVGHSQSSLEDGWWILENTAHLDCNYLKHRDLFFYGNFKIPL